MRSALEELPDEQCRVIELAYFGGFSHSEIAEMLSMPLGTVKGRMRLGLRKLRVSLALQPTATVTATPVAVAAPQHIDVAENALLTPPDPEPLGRKPAKPAAQDISSPKTSRTLSPAKPAASAKTPAASPKKAAKPKKTNERLAELKSLLRRV